MAAILGRLLARANFSLARTKENNANALFSVLAERVGFEPTEGVNPQRFSRPPPSTTQPSLHIHFEMTEGRRFRPPPSGRMKPAPSRFHPLSHLSNI